MNLPPENVPTEVYMKKRGCSPMSEAENFQEENCYSCIAVPPGVKIFEGSFEEVVQLNKSILRNHSCQESPMCPCCGSRGQTQARCSIEWHEGGVMISLVSCLGHGNSFFQEIIYHLIHASLEDVVESWVCAGLKRLSFELGNCWSPAIAQQLSTLQIMEIRLTHINAFFLRHMLVHTKSLESLVVLSYEEEIGNIQPLIEGFTKNVSLRSVDLRRCYQSSFLSAILQGLGTRSSSPVLDFLTVDGNFLRNTSVSSQLYRILHHRVDSLRELDLSFGAPSADGHLDRLFSAVAVNESIEELALSLYRFTTAEALSFGHAMVINKTIKVVRLRAPNHTNFRNQNLMGFFNHLASMKELRTLDLRGNFLGVHAWSSLATGLAGNESLRILELGNTTYDEPNTALVKILAGIKQQALLQELDLSYVPISGALMAILVTALQSNHALKKLLLVNCSIGNFGAGVFAAQIPAMRGLESLLLDWNEFEAEGARRIVSGLRQTFSIQKCTVFSQVYTSPNGLPYMSSVNGYQPEQTEIEKLLDRNRLYIDFRADFMHIPSGLWPVVLQRSNDPSLIFLGLRDAIFSGS